MSTLFNIFNQIYNYIVLKIQGEFIVSCFLVYSIFFACINVWKAVFMVRPNFYIFFFLLICLVVFYIFFLIFPSSYYNIVEIIFNDVFLSHKYIISFGAICIQKYSYIFGVYISLSISSFHLIRENPDNFCIYLGYVLCVCFRNFFLIPFLGYKFIIQIHKKKRELLAEGSLNKETENNYPLFLSTPLINNKKFCCNFQSWCDWIDQLQPSPESSKKISYITIPTSSLWYLSWQLKYESLRVIQAIQENQKKVEYNIFDILQYNRENIREEWLFKKLAFILDSQHKKIDQEMSDYQEMHPIISGFYFHYNSIQTQKWIDNSFCIVKDSIDLKYCWFSALENGKYQNCLYICTQKYLPEYLSTVENLDFPEFVEKKTQNYLDHLNTVDCSPPVVSNNQSPHSHPSNIPDIYTCREDFLHTFAFLKKFFVFIF